MEDNSKIVDNPELSLGEALIPVLVLIALLAVNIFYAEGALLGDYSNQYILLFSGGVAAVVGLLNKTGLDVMARETWNNLKSVIVPIIILSLVGALAGTWLISGIIPAMVYYGLQVLSPDVFLPASVIIAAIISIATGSSWTTSATVGIALIGIGEAMGIPPGMIAGAVISGAYFGDKMSPLSDTTNLAPAMAGTDLFTHIRYMTITTIPSIVITLIVFTILSFTTETTGEANVLSIQKFIAEKFNITPWLFAVPLAVIALIVLKTKPLVALASGVLLAGVFALVFQSPLITEMTGSPVATVTKSIFTDVSVTIDNSSYLAGLSQADSTSLVKSNPDLVALWNDKEVFEGKITSESLASALQISNLSAEKIADKIQKVESLVTIERLSSLFNSGGMLGMLWTILLVMAAMVFGGVMDGIGALARITNSLLEIATSIFGLFASTVASCLALNLTASDQYLAIVVPGKMFAKAYEDRGLAPENLSRTLEDSGTVTSVLVPWNTCGAYQSQVLGVGVGEYFVYAVFNYLSPFMTLLVAALDIKIRMLREEK